MTGNDASQGKRSLWISFVSIAQPYFFPRIRGGAWVTLLLMTMLLVSLFGLFFMIVAGIALAANHLAPELTAKIAPGLVSIVTATFRSNRRISVTRWSMYATIPSPSLSTRARNRRSTRSAVDSATS